MWFLQDYSSIFVQHFARIYWHHLFFYVINRNWPINHLYIYLQLSDGVLASVILTCWHFLQACRGPIGVTQRQPATRNLLEGAMTLPFVPPLHMVGTFTCQTSSGKIPSLVYQVYAQPLYEFSHVGAGMRVVNDQTAAPPESCRSFESGCSLRDAFRSSPKFILGWRAVKYSTVHEYVIVFLFSLTSTLLFGRIVFLVFLS